MNAQYYKEILEQFKTYHPYLAEGIEDWRPRGEYGIRVLMKDGTEYDYHSTSNAVRNVKARPMYKDDLYDEVEWRKIFSDRLAEYMAAKGISQQALSEYTGLGKATINGYVNGKVTPSAYALTKLARALDCAVMDLLT